MKKFFVTGICILFSSVLIAQNQQQVSATSLVEIVDNNNFKQLSGLVSSLGYHVLDSSKDVSGGLFYYAREIKIGGNVLACSVSAKNKIEQLSFHTSMKETSQRLKSDLKKAGFISSGASKQPLDKTTETEDFEKGKILVSTACKINDDGETAYEFTFMKW